MLFSEFVATRLNDVSDRTVAHKAITSFLASLVGLGETSVENQLGVWIASMIDQGLSLSSRDRYIKKLNAIYREYCSEFGADGNPFDKVKELRGLEGAVCAKQLEAEFSNLEKIFDVLLVDAKTRPELAVFLYMLFNVTTDIESVVYLTTESYRQEFPQLNDVINIDDFHHSRKYVFDLKQSRKRKPQLVREVMAGIELYLRMKGIRQHESQTVKLILALWILKARKTGVKLPDIKGMLDVIPEEFKYLRFIQSSDLTDSEKLMIKHRVAKAFSPSGKRWYALKIRRRFDFEYFRKLVEKNLGNLYDEETLFYPYRQVTSRVDKKIVTENVPVIPDVVFFRVQPRNVRKMDALVRSENIGWIFRNSNNIERDYSVIDAGSMALFQRMIGIFTQDMKIEMTPERPLSIGRDVVITGGIMEGYRGRIYDIKEGSDVRRIYIRLSDRYFIRAEAAVDEFYVKPIEEANTINA
ncbi:hypothetical protein [Bacteroides caecimuris]|uniref:hypothetical protein n=1 Tax=Bacteroides caecimuris TaxID=1796613 RepID=UPI0026E59047|nr:hypothetical protein [Bacteroides caecimuris]